MPHVYDHGGSCTDCLTARRMATNRIITISIITILVLLIVAVIFSKFR